MGLHQQAWAEVNVPSSSSARLFTTVPVPGALPPRSVAPRRGCTRAEPPDMLPRGNERWGWGAVFGWLLKNPRVTAIARVIHEMCCDAHHQRDTLGAPLHRYFTNHPMLKNHRAPTPSDRDQVHIFWLSDGRQGFHAMVCDGQQDAPAWVAIAPDGDFEGVHVQSGRKGRYMVRIVGHSPRPQGRLATKLVDEFVAIYDALDTSV